jgi:phage baseplate assembly protein W
MTLFRREYQGYRVAETRRGDTLQRVAAREIGDAERWFELAFINNLRPPYLTDDSVAQTDGVLLTGSTLRIPASADYVPSHLDPKGVFGSDLILTNGELIATSGDLNLVTGAPNLSQAIHHVVLTDLGDLVWHPRYGCGVHRLLGQKADDIAQRLAAALVRRAVIADDRIQSATVDKLEINGDAIHVQIRANAIDGASIQVSV